MSKQVDQWADARAGEVQAALQTLLTARNSMCGERTRAINALNAALRVHDLGVDARRKVSRPTIGMIAAWPGRRESLSLSTARAEAVRLAHRILELDAAVKQNTASLRAVILQANQAVLLDLPGLGPVNAGVVLAAWSHPGRVRNDAAFAKLGGVCPLEVSSGRSHEHRLNRTGDRQLNRALHSIAKTRMQHHPPTRAYLERRIAEGLTTPRIRRCLKRYIARELHRTLTRITA